MKIKRTRKVECQTLKEAQELARVLKLLGASYTRIDGNTLSFIPPVQMVEDELLIQMLKGLPETVRKLVEDKRNYDSLFGE